MAWSLLIHNIFLYRRYWIIRHKQQYCTWGGWIVPCSLHTTQLCLTLAVGCGGNVLVPITLLLFKSPCPVLLQGFKGMVTRSALASTRVLKAPGSEHPTEKVTWSSRAWNVIFSHRLFVERLKDVTRLLVESHKIRSEHQNWTSYSLLWILSSPPSDGPQTVSLDLSSGDGGS